MFKSLRNDIRVIKDRDPAAKNTLEVLLCYSGLHAIWLTAWLTASTGINGSSLPGLFPPSPASLRESKSIRSADWQRTLHRPWHGNRHR